MDNSLVEKVKEYNKRYKEATSELNRVNAQINVYEQEIDKLCAELSSALGVEVTKDNALELYNQKSTEIENNLALGNEILSRIDNGNSSNNVQSSNNFTGQATNQVTAQTVAQPEQVMTFESEFNPNSVIGNTNTDNTQSIDAFSGMFSTAIDDI